MDGRFARTSAGSCWREPPLSGRVSVHPFLNLKGPSMSFYEQLVAETPNSRDAFLSIPRGRRTLRHGAPRSLYLDFLAEAYHHVKHTFPLLALAASRTSDERYQDALVEYMEEERGHEKWILNDIGALGGNPAAVRDGQGGSACRIMVGYSYYAIEHISPYAFLG